MKILCLIVALLCSTAIRAETEAQQSTAVVAQSMVSPVANDANNKVEDLTTLPLDKGLPMIVRVGLYYQDITAFDENANTFTGTVDSRLRWEDLRLRYPETDTANDFKEYRNEKAAEKLKTIWTPSVALTNMTGDPSYQVTNLRIYPNGLVEVMQRTTAEFSVQIDAARFPFDKQTLTVEMEIRKETSDEAALIFLQEDLEFSKAAKTIAIDGWDNGLVNIKRLTRPGWYGSFHSALVVGFDVQRQVSKTIAPIFIPLLASLFIPLVGIWMHRIEKGDFAIEAFELANVIVGGLFAVVGLNFSIGSAYAIVATGDNTVTRLFALNYATLGIALAIIVLMYRFHILKRFYGAHVQEEAFLFILWAVPVLVFGTAIAFVSVAMVG